VGEVRRNGVGATTEIEVVRKVEGFVGEGTGDFEFVVEITTRRVRGATFLKGLADAAAVGVASARRLLDVFRDLNFGSAVGGFLRRDVGDGFSGVPDVRDDLEDLAVNLPGDGTESVESSEDGVEGVVLRRLTKVLDLLLRVLRSHHLRCKRKSVSRRSGRERERKNEL
jgi:hypothetical protein